MVTPPNRRHTTRTTARPARRVHRSWLSILLLAMVMALLLASPALAFSDVDSNHPYADAIGGLSDKGIISGYSNSTEFGPKDPVKRAQFAKMIVGTLGISPNSSTQTRFTDLGSPDAKGYPHIFVQAAFDKGITYGINTAQTQFAPWNHIHRDQVASMIVRGINSIFPGTLAQPPAGTPSDFAGVPAPHGANLRLAEYNGLLDGLTGLGPNWNVTDNATRGEVAQVLWNALDLLAPNDVSVYADGSGDYATLEEAVADVDAGTTIHLGPGTFRLSKTLTVDFSLDLVGNGMTRREATVITCNNTVMDITSCSFTAQDITFSKTATNSPGGVMKVNDVNLDLLRCSFTGGVKRDDQGGGSGLYLYGATDATIRDCVFTQNDNAGIAVCDHAKATLERNVCTKNQSVGIGFWDDSSGVARENTCTDNTGSGIAVRDRAEATLERNVCTENRNNGISFWDDSSGIARENTCTDNTYNGIAIGDHAKTTLERNVCTENQSNGIGFWDDSSGIARENTCTDNTYNGIALNDRAEATLERNVCTENGIDGIALYDRAEALVESNTCLNNTEAGICFDETSRGTARNNECAGNNWGLYVRSTAGPSIGANNLHGNTVNPQLYDERSM
ncbi:MAG: NosD domain-containing protein [Thermoleophilia bacterium]|jgi:parallel beta-helix repeat protein